MMELKIYEEKEKKVSVRLCLKGAGDGEVKVCCVDEDGEIIDAGNVLVFQSDGRIRMCGGVNDDVGFKLSDRCVKIVGYSRD